MRRLFTLATALVLAFALSIGGIGAFAQDGAKKVKTKVSIKFVAGAPATGPYDQPGADKFKGKVRPKTKSRKIKRKCRKNRTVKVKRVGSGTIGTDKTNKKGRYKVVVANAPADQYFAKAKKKVVRVKGKRVVCKKGKSKTITVPG